eukprot:sb/3475849/
MTLLISLQLGHFIFNLKVNVISHDRTYLINHLVPKPPLCGLRFRALHARVVRVTVSPNQSLFQYIAVQNVLHRLSNATFLLLENGPRHIGQVSDIGATGNMGYLTTFGHNFFPGVNKVTPSS